MKRKKLSASHSHQLAPKARPKQQQRAAKTKTPKSEKMNSPVIVRVIQKVIIHNGEEEHTLHNTVTVSSTWAAASYSQSPCSQPLRCYTTNSIPFPFFGSPPRPRPTLFHSLSPSTASPYTNVFFQGRILLETAQCRITFWQTRIKHFSLSFVSCAAAVRWDPTVRDLRRLMACRSAVCGCGEGDVCRMWMRRRWKCLPPHGLPVYRVWIRRRWRRFLSLPSSEHSTAQHGPRRVSHYTYAAWPDW